MQISLLIILKTLRAGEWDELMLISPSPVLRSVLGASTHTQTSPASTNSAPAMTIIHAMNPEMNNA
jgi:hypothetical protein